MEQIERIGHMHILVIDAQGGGIGRQLVAQIREELPDTVITAVGTNSLATSAMLKAGADHGATGENAVIVGARKADVIVGPIGIVIACRLACESAPAAANALRPSSAKRFLSPINHCDNIVVGIGETGIRDLVREVIQILRQQTTNV